MVAGLSRVSPVANRLNVATAPSGAVVVDDTFNANPASAVAALNVLSSLELTGRRVVVTPGLVELGREQYGENLRLAEVAEAMAAELVVVGRTNAVALAAGSSTSPRARWPPRGGRGVGACNVGYGRRGVVLERPSRPLPLMS